MTPGSASARRTFALDGEWVEQARAFHVADCRVEDAFTRGDDVVSVEEGRRPSV